MADYRISRAANLLGVSQDTVRRWIAKGRLTPGTDEAGRTTVPGKEVALLSQERATKSIGRTSVKSARNQAEGLVTSIKKGDVMSQVDLQCGPYRFVSLMSTEAVEDLGLQIGDLATAVVKSTNVIVEKPEVSP